MLRCLSSPRPGTSSYAATSPDEECRIPRHSMKSSRSSSCEVTQVKAARNCICHGKSYTTYLTQGMSAITQLPCRILMGRCKSDVVGPSPEDCVFMAILQRGCRVRQLCFVFSAVQLFLHPTKKSQFPIEGLSAQCILRLPRKAAETLKSSDPRLKTRNPKAYELQSYPKP